MLYPDAVSYTHLGVTDWQTRMKELLGLTPDNESNYVTAMWVKPEDVFRPAYISEDVYKRQHITIPRGVLA